MNIDNLVIKVKSEGVSDSKRQLDQLGTSAESTEKKVRKLVDAVDDMVKKFSSGSNAVKAMTDAMSVVNKSTQASDAAIKALNNSVMMLSKQIEVMGSSFTKGTASVNTSTINIVHNTAAMTDAHAAARGLTGSLGALWLTYGNVAPLAVGAAIGASMKQIVSLGAEVENTLEAIRLKGGATVQEVDELRKAVLDIGTGIYGPQEVSKAFESLILAGLKAKEAISGIGAALNLATAGGSTVEKAAESLVTIGTAVGATSKEYDYLADGITTAANISLASVDSIAEAVKRASVVNKLYGASFEDILTQTAALAQLGIKNTAAGTAITNFYANAMGGSQKAKAALDALGFSFQDADGKAKPIVKTFEELNQKLQKFDLVSQKKIITDIFGERALRDVESMRDLVKQTADDTEHYANKLEEIQGQVQKAAGTSALIAAQQALTAENQMKSVANTLSTVFVEAFKEIEPQIVSIAKSLREVFASQDFKNTVQNIASGFTTLAEVLAKNIPLITAVGEGFLAVGGAMAGGALFTRLIPVVQGLIAVMFGLATSFTAAGTAAEIGAVGITAVSTAAKLLPGIGIAIGLITTAWLLYEASAKKATTSTDELYEAKKKLAGDYNSDFLKNLEEEAKRLEKVNTELLKGASLTQAQTTANQQLALTKQMNMLQDATSAAHEELVKASDAYEKLAKQNQFDPKVELKTADAAKRLSKAQDAVSDSLKAQNEFRTKALTLEERITAASQAQSDALAKRQADADAAAKAAAGTASYNGKEKSTGPNFFEQLIDSGNKWLAGHKTRVDAMMQEINTGSAGTSKFFQAEAKEAINSIAATDASKKLSAAKVEELKARIMAIAVQRDEVKTQEDNLKKYAELKISVLDQTKGNEAYFKSIIDGSDKVIGKYSEQLTAAAQRAGMTEKEIDAAQRLGKLLDEQIKLKDEIKKLDTLTSSAGTKAEQYMDQANALAEYGSKAKSTALDLAKAKVAQMDLSDSAVQLKANNYLLAASYETVAKALVNINQIGATAAEETLKIQADSLLMFEENEKKKVEIKANATKKIIDMNLEQARTASLSGDPKAMGAYLKAVEDAATAKATIDENTAIKSHNIELEDWKKTVNSIVDSTLKGFDDIFKKGGNIWKSLIGSIKSMFQSLVIDFIKKEFAKPLVLNIIAGVSGSLGMSGISGTANALAGNSGAGGNPISNVTGLASLLSGGATAAIGKGIGAVGGALGSSTLAEFGSGMSGSAAAAADALGAEMTSTAAAGASFGAAVSTAIPWIAAAVAAASLWSKAFGMGPKTIQSQGIRGTVSDSMASGEGYADWTQKGGWFRSNKSGTDTSQLPTDVMNSLTAGFNSLKNISDGLAKSVGVTSNALDGFTKSFDIQFVGLKEVKGTAAEQQAIIAENSKIQQEAVTKFFTTLGDEMAQKLVPNLTDFAMQGETASQTLQRLSKTFDATNQVATLLGRSVEELFGSKGLDSAKVRQSLVDIAGGVDALTSKTSSYINSIYTDAEKIEPVKKALSEAFSSLGYNMPATKEAFKNIVDGLNLQDVGQQKVYVSLMELAPAFAQVSDYTDKAAQAAKDAADKQRDILKDRLSIEMQVAQLEKNDNDIRSITNDQRKLEISTMDQSLIPWQERLNFLQDEKEALDKLNAYNKEKLSMEGEIAAATKDQGAAYVVLAAQRQMELAATDNALVGLKARVYAIQDEAAALEKANAIRDKSLSMQLTIAQYEKDTAKIASILADQRKIEMSTMDASLVPLQKRINAIEDEKTLLDSLETKASTALDRLKTAVQKEQDIIKQNYSDQIDATKSSYSAQIDLTKKNFEALIKLTKDNAKKQIDALKASTKTQVDEYKKQQDAAKQSLQAITSVFNAISNTIDSTKIESYSLDKARRQSAQQLIHQSRGMDVTKISGLDNALKDLSQPSTKFFKSFEDYAVDQAKTADDLMGLRDDAKSQMDYQQLTIDKLDDTINTLQENSDLQIQAIQDSSDAAVQALENSRDASVAALEAARDAQIAALEKARDDQLNSLDKVLATAQLQLDALNKVDSSVLSVKDALAGYQSAVGNLSSQISAIAQAAAQPVVVPTPVQPTLPVSSGGMSGLNDLYQTLLGRQPDQAGIDYWTNSMNQNGISLTDVASSIVHSSEYQNLHHFDVGTNFIPEDMPAMVHKGERIVPAADNAELMRRLDSEDKSAVQGDLTQAINNLSVAVKSGDLATNQKLTEFVRIVKRWDGEGMPGTRPGVVIDVNVI